MQPAMFERVLRMLAASVEIVVCNVQVARSTSIAQAEKMISIASHAALTRNVMQEDPMELDIAAFAEAAVEEEAAALKAKGQAAAMQETAAKQARPAPSSAQAEQAAASSLPCPGRPLDNDGVLLLSSPDDGRHPVNGRGDQNPL